MIIKNKRVFISGGAGVIGIELVSLLSKLGAIILVGDIKDKPDLFSEKIIYRKGDLNFLKEEEINDFKPDIFIHLAATFERTKESLEFYEENYWHNLNLSNRLAKLFIRQKNIKKIIFASSYLVYDSELYLSNLPSEKPFELSEKNHLNPRNLIGLAKFYHEKELNFLKKFYLNNPKIVSIRIYRGYGKNSRDVISRWIREILRKKTIFVYKSENIFDFIYSKDSAKGIIEIIKTNFEGSINLGTGKGTSIKQIISYLNSKFKDMQYKQIKSEIKFESSAANINILKKITKWRPKYNYKKAIDEIISFEKKNLRRKNDSNIVKFKILVTSSSSKFSLISDLARSAKKISEHIEIIAADSNNKALTKYGNTLFWKMPKTNTSNLKHILSYCINNKVSIIIPTRDQELIFWSKNKNYFKKNNIDVLVSDRKYLDICIDKLKFSEFGLKNKLAIIKSSLNIKKNIHKKYVVKERYGSGSNNVGINLNYKQAKNFAQKIKDPIFQKYIFGKEVSIDVWISRKFKIKGIILRTRDIIVGGESKLTKTFVNDKIEKQIQQFFRKLKVNGHIVVQGILDDKNSFNIIECNARFGGASSLSVKKGLDSFYWSILESMGKNPDDYTFTFNKKIISQLRYEKDKYIYDTNI
ncbi:MAG: GDP-L-fucose synthase [Alphaproteobacteria bacterium MarineAlpha5_Bin8]|nr:MAG: GDP-L-fucose synthase [Alphaproteobacteria bacterium MarineAlpha5_Bin8]PPR54161.1 MAG: GDP-L-fucose synthase [Alphaproteobacteria bacterium MarineAlpha5_Bin6]|tara:strand:- start:712 stop:2634 length:1923 start_codon:yes stop_codon:yes gene_type:complete